MNLDRTQSTETPYVTYVSAGESTFNFSFTVTSDTEVTVEGRTTTS